MAIQLAAHLRFDRPGDHATLRRFWDAPNLASRPGLKAVELFDAVLDGRVKALWIDKEPASGMEHPEEFDANDYDFIPARVSDNPIYAGDKSYLKSLRGLPSHLKRAFLDGDWNVYAGQYFDRFDCVKHVVRPEQIDWKPWWPRWISIDWGFEHPAAAYWYSAVPGASFAGTPIPRSAATRDLPPKRSAEQIPRFARNDKSRLHPQRRQCRRIGSDLRRRRRLYGGDESGAQARVIGSDG